MQQFEIKLFINNVEECMQVQEDKAPSGTYLITQNQKFIARVFKDSDGKWKTREISDLSPSVVEAIGLEINSALNLG
ncbi:hypothetical protein [Pedobacter sp. SYSU D00535]|uniref:hypothetical protein n=1 Tax=Pedobacter sp. SYSU D00535 TaxID=2810308 RepID=UPI001A96F408|nr:hypothetical protein [Pedobacter sp. SYSU D00535]